MGKRKINETESDEAQSNANAENRKPENSEALLDASIENPQPEQTPTGPRRMLKRTRSMSIKREVVEELQRKQPGTTLAIAIETLISNQPSAIATLPVVNQLNISESHSSSQNLSPYLRQHSMLNNAVKSAEDEEKVCQTTADGFKIPTAPARRKG